jgi:hypothetical protein
MKYFFLLLGLSWLVSACVSDSDQGNLSDRSERVDLVRDTPADDTLIGDKVPLAPPPVEGETRLADDIEDSKKDEVVGCTEKHQEEIAAWKSRIANQEQTLALIDDVQVQNQIKASIDELKANIQHYVNQYNCTQ